MVQMLSEHLPSRSFRMGPTRVTPKCLGWRRGKKDVVFSSSVLFSGGSVLRFGSSAEHRPRQDPRCPEGIYTPQVSVSRMNGRRVLRHMGEAVSATRLKMDKKHPVPTLNKTRDISSPVAFTL